MPLELTYFYPRLVAIPAIRNEISSHFGAEAGRVIEAMTSGRNLHAEADDIREIVMEFLSDHGIEIALFKGSGRTNNDHSTEKAYFQEHHPEAMALLAKMGGAPGFEQDDFTIRVLQYDFLYAVTAEDFEDLFFDNATDAIAFAKSNYAPFIENYAVRVGAR